MGEFINEFLDWLEEGEKKKVVEIQVNLTKKKEFVLLISFLMQCYSLYKQNNVRRLLITNLKQTSNFINAFQKIVNSKQSRTTTVNHWYYKDQNVFLE